MTAPLRLVLLFLLLASLTMGCSSGHNFSKAELDRAQQALDTALASWKKGEQPKKLTSLPEPILFAEEGPQKGVKLLDYEIIDNKHTDAETIRFRVRLKLKDRRGRNEEREATYAVGLKSPIVIGRDPYF